MKQTKTNIFWAFLALFLGLLWLPAWAQAQEPVIEDGTAEHPFLIESKQELIDLFKWLHKGTFYHNGTTFVESNSGCASCKAIESGGKDKHFKLTTDIFLNTGNIAGCQGTLPTGGLKWEPKDFSGVFDGDGHVISGMYISSTDTGGLGLFRILTDTAAVRNLGVVNAYVEGEKFAGGIAGMMLANSRVENCFVDANIIVNNNYVGLITGVTKDEASIKNCYSTGHIFSDKPNVSFLGGIVGYNMIHCTVTNCYSSVFLDYEGTTAGGIYGYTENTATMTNCYYDKQLCDNYTELSQGLVTTDMTNAYLADEYHLGTAFVHEDGFYPYLRAFSFDNPGVRLSVLPVFMHAESDSYYSTMADLLEDFTVGTAEGVTWTMETEHDAATLNVPNVTLNKQGWIMLVATMDDGRGNTYVKPYEMFPDIAPYLGTKQNPFTIDNYKDLTNFRKGINSALRFKYKHYMVPAFGLNTYFLQTADIDVSAEANWEVIGTSAEIAFRGIYNGGHHLINNIKITSGDTRGFFGNTEKAVVENLVFENATLTGASSSAVVCGYMRGGIMDSCVVKSNKTFSGYGKAGIVYRAILNDTIIIRNCANYANISASGHAAGIIAVLQAKYGLIDHCANYGDNYGSEWNGGVLGYTGYQAGFTTKAVVQYCYNSGHISSGGGDWDDIGGIAGLAERTTFKFCLNEGTVTGGSKSGGILGSNNSSNSIYYCINAGTIKRKSTSANLGNFNGISDAPCYYCLNTGNVINPNGNANGISVGGGSHCVNAGMVLSNNSAYGVNMASGYNVGFVEGKSSLAGNNASAKVYYDKQVAPLSYGVAKTTDEMLGDGLKTLLDTNIYIFSEGLYPRLKWTDTLEWARKIALAAATPIKLSSTSETFSKLKEPFSIYGCDSNMVWRVDSGDILADFVEPQSIVTGVCTENHFTPALATLSLNDSYFTQYYIDGERIRSIKMRRYYPPIPDTLTVDSLGDLQIIQKGINSNRPFLYKGYIIPRFADSCFFRLTTDITLPAGNWTSIGSVGNNTYFQATFLGDNHTIRGLKSAGTYSGLFGMVKNGHIYDLNLAEVNITSGGECTGAVAGQLLGSVVDNCTVKGTITGSYSYTAGIVGLSSSAKDTIRNCINFAEVKGSTQSNVRVAGIVASLTGVVSHCENYGNITSATGGTSCQVAGISCSGGTVSYCANMGNISGAASCKYTGGVCANNAVSFCYNVGNVMAKPGDGNADNYVGGVTGQGDVSYCYNAGQVNGYNRKYVGGVNGYGKVSNSYNSNFVSSTGSQRGSLSGYNNTSSKNGYYDNQMSIMGALANVDYTARPACGLPTLSMLGTALEGSNKLGSNANWVFTPGLYPRIRGLENTDAAYASVMPVVLKEGDNARKVDNSFEMRGCDAAQWTLSEGGSCILMDKENCMAGVRGLGVVTMTAGKNDVPYKNIRLLVNISEDNPLIVKSKEELEHFRDGINREYCYYKMSDSTYRNTLTAEDSLDMLQFICIRDGGRDLFFRLVVDVDLSTVDGWSPIGADDYNFQGSFNGDNHTITGLKLKDGTHSGLFGNALSATIKNLKIDKGFMQGSGSSKGFICGYNNGGTMTNCSVTHSKVAGTSSNTGVICGYNKYGFIRDCFSENDTVLATGSYAGGICGYQQGATIENTYSDKLYVSGAGDCKGGIVGCNSEASKVNNCDIRNSLFENVSGSKVGGICGQNVAALNSIISSIISCNNINTVIRTTNTYVGGIVGLCGYESGASHTNTEVRNCKTKGGLVYSMLDHVGGICGRKHYVNNVIANCENENIVQGRSYVGGIAGSAYLGEITLCHNRASVTATQYYAGGVVGHSEYYPYMSNCTNSGNVEAALDYVGGIVGYQVSDEKSYIRGCLNTGMVKGRYYIGGVTGMLKAGDVANNCNTGIVDGVSYVGGIIGYENGTTKTCSNNFNVGWVWGKSSVGAICGSVKDVSKFSNNYYDSQMVNEAGIDNKDIVGRAEGRLTSQLVGVNSLLGSAWTTAAKLYPRIKVLDTMTLSIAAASPVYLPVSPSDTITAEDIPSGSSFTMEGCPNFIWEQYEGNYVDITGCEAETKNRGYAQLSIRRGEDTLKVVQLSVGISEEHPLEIVNVEQLKRFRDLIDSNKTFYYDSRNKVFMEQDNSTSDNRFVSIRPGGDRMFFALTGNMDLTLETKSWAPIGTATSYFKGHFNGRGYSIKGMKITTNAADQGFFGYAQGTIKNLVMEKASITGTGNYHGALCARNYAKIEDCGTIGGTVKGTNIVGGLVAYSSNGTIDRCYNENFAQGTATVGGLVGKMETGGYIRHSINTGFVTATAANSYAGGLVGNTTLEVLNCYNTGNVNGNQYVGGIAGYSTSANLKYCYNVGCINSSSENYVGAIAVASAGETYPKNCYYDSQMSIYEYGFAYPGGSGNDERYAWPFFTDVMTDSALVGFSPDEWIFTPGLYPQLKEMSDKGISIASVTPVFISEMKNADKVVFPFNVGIENEVSWDRYGDAMSLNLSNINATGEVYIATCGSDTLKVTKDNNSKLVTVFVEKIETAVWRDTVCDGYYRWAANGRIYNKTGDYTQASTVSQGCDSVVTLHLVIPEAMEVTLDVKDRSCFGSNDCYAKAEVKGGFGTYNYYWYKAEDMETAVSTTLNTAVGSTALPDPQPGDYVLIVEDAVHPACSKTYDITISEPTELVAEELGHDSRCYNQNDGYINLGVYGGTMPYKVDWTTEEGGEGSKDDFSQPDTAHISDALPLGTYTVVVTDDHNCQVTITGIVLEEDATPYVITAYSESRKYNAEEMDGGTYTLKVGDGAAEQHHSGDTVVLSTGDSLKVVLEAPKMTDAGTASNNILSYSVWNGGEDRTCRYNIDPHNGTLEILKRNVTITSGTSQRGFIEGQPLTNHTVTVTGDGFLPEKGQDTANVEVTGTITNAGSVVNTFTCYYTEALNLAIDNYNITKKEGTLTIAADGEIIITAPSDEKKYDGTPLTVASDAYMVAGLHTGDTVINLQVVNLTITDAGSITTSIDTSNFGNFDVVDKLTKVTTKHNYDSVTLHTGTLTVTKREVSLTSNSKTDQIYNGDTLKLPTVTVGGDGFVAGEVDTVYAVGARCSVGDSLNRIVIEGSYKEGNYVIAKNEGHLTVLKKDLSIIGDEASYPYDGVEHVKNTYKTPSLISTHTISGVTYEAKGSTVGDYVGVFSDTTGVISIKDAAGNEVKGNYNITLVPETLHITPNTNPLIISSARGSFKFDGKDHLHTYRVYSITYKGSQVSGSGVDTVFVLSTGDTVTITPVNAGRGISQVLQSDTNDFTYSITHQENYTNIEVIKDSIIITPRVLEIWSRNASKDYDGTPLNNKMLDPSGDGLVDGNVIKGDDFPEITNVGSMTNSFTYSMTNGSIENYSISTHFGTLTVNPALITLTPKDTSRGYGEADPLPFKFTASGLKNNEVLDGLYLDEHRPILSTNATVASVPGLYDIEIDTSGVRLQNYTFRLNKGTLTINKSKLVVTAKSPDTHLTYDGELHNFGNGGNDYIGVTPDGMMADDSISSIIVSGAATVAGTYDITLAGASLCRKGHPEINTTDYYDISYTKGQFVIDPVEITIRPNSLTHIFNDNTYNADSTEAPHYTIESGALVPHDSIVGIRISGSRLMPGVDSLVIDPASIIVVDTNEVKNYTTVDARDNMAGGYRITLKKGYVKITDRGEACYRIDLKAKSAECIYGESASASGLEQTEFDIDGHHYTVTGLTANATNSAVGTWPVPIVGDSVVVDAYGNDVTSQFCIKETDGQIIVHPRPLRLQAWNVTKEYDGREHSFLESGLPYCQAVGDTAVLGTDRIYSAFCNGSRTLPGTTAINIIPDSVVIHVLVSGANVTSNYTVAQLIPGTLTITPPATPIPLTVSSKSDTVNYDGEAHTLNGFDTLKLTHNGHVFTISGISATVTKTEAGTYKNAVTGTPKVTDDQGNDVTAYFAVTVDTGTLVINKRPIHIKGKSKSVYYDGNCHDYDELDAPGYIIPDSSQLLAGHSLTVQFGSVELCTLGDTNIRINSVTIKNAIGNDVTSSYTITADTGKLTIEGYPQKLTISSNSHKFDCYDKGQKYEHYTVKYGETTCAAVEGSDYKFVLAPVTGIHDTLTITPTCLGTTAAGSSDSVKNTFTYVLQNDIQYVGTRDTVYGYLTQPDTLKLTLTSDNPVCDDGSVMSFTTGGNGGNKFHLSTAATTDSTTHGIYNGLSASSYTVSVTDSKGCSATQSVTLTTVEATAIEGITRAGEITTYAPDTTVDASGDLTAFPALTASGDIIAQPKLSNCTASVTDHKITVSVTVESIGVLPILVFEVSKDAGFSTTAPMYTHKVAPVTEGDKTYDFENLPTGTYYVRAKLYNCAGGSITATPESDTVEVEH